MPEQSNTTEREPSCDICTHTNGYHAANCPAVGTDYMPRVKRRWFRRSRDDITKENEA